VLYLQLVRGCSPLQVGILFLPASLMTAAFSLGLSAKLVIRFGIKPPLVTGLLVITVALLLFRRMSTDGNLALEVLPPMMLMGVGGGMAFNPMLLAAMSGVPVGESGLASGIVSTAMVMGGVLGLAVIASVAAARTNYFEIMGVNHRLALNGGYHAGFLVAAVLTTAAAFVAATLLSVSRDSACAPMEA
jgi:hypothetical protein